MTSSFEETSDAAAVDADVETRQKSLAKMAKTANAAEDADVMMIPLRNRVTTTKRPRKQPTPLQMTSNFEETSDAAAVDADVGT